MKLNEVFSRIQQMYRGMAKASHRSATKNFDEMGVEGEAGCA